MKNIKIKTDGMHCTSCEMLIKDSLEELDGVSNADASHKTGIVSVDFDENKVAETDLRELIEIEGYNIE